MSNIQYKKVEDGLPITGCDDSKFNGSWYEVDCYVIADGIEVESEFYACWEESIDFEEESVFIMDFDEENVTHWAIIK